MTKFKIGDIVLIKHSCTGLLGKTGLIKQSISCCDDDHFAFVLTRDDGGLYFELFEARDLELIETPSTLVSKLQELINKYGELSLENVKNSNKPAVAIIFMVDEFITAAQDLIEEYKDK